jgi:hypothetical protein
MMAGWGTVGSVYGAGIAIAAVVQGRSSRTRVSVAAAAGVYGLLCAWTATFDSLWVHLVAPAVALLCGYWLPGPLFHEPQPRLESLLLRHDQHLFHALALDRRLERAPRWVLEALELAYALDYVAVAVGAVVVALDGRDSLIAYWTVVLAAGLTCYAALPWARSRPPRAIERPGAVARRGPTMRRLNLAILNAASVQANTIPSGHVAAVLAAGLAASPVSAIAGGTLLGMAAAIAAAAVACRYHYAWDCVTGALVAVIVWSLVSSFSC